MDGWKSEETALVHSVLELLSLYFSAHMLHFNTSAACSCISIYCFFVKYLWSFESESVVALRWCHKAILPDKIRFQQASRNLHSEIFSPLLIVNVSDTMMTNSCFSYNHRGTAVVKVLLRPLSHTIWTSLMPVSKKTLSDLDQSIIKCL